MSNIERPTIPAEVADAIEALRADRLSYSNEDILLLRMTDGVTEGRREEAVSLQLIPFDTLLAALVNGYGRELTEEEKKRDIQRTYDTYRHRGGRYDTAEADDAFADGMEYALDTLGVKIEGVNA